VRGDDRRSGSMFSYVDIEKKVRPDHPLRTIKTLVDEALADLSGRFARLYSRSGRPSIPPEQLVRAMLLKAFYSIGSERQSMERFEFDLLFRWFVGLGIDDAVWDATTFTKNSDRLPEGDIARAFLRAVMSLPRVKRPLSSDDFSLYGTLLEAWALMNSFRPKTEDGTDKPPPGDPPAGRNGEVNFHRERRVNATHASTTDPEARLYRKGRGRKGKLCYLSHALMENHNGFIAEACLTRAEVSAERNAALAMIEDFAYRPNCIRLGADKGYDTRDFVNEARAMNVTPHVAQNLFGRRSAIDGRVTRRAGYVTSKRIHKRIEEDFGWGKEIRAMRWTHFRGLPRVGRAFSCTAAAYNLVRLSKLLAT